MLYNILGWLQCITHNKACIGYICPRGPHRGRMSRATSRDNPQDPTRENPSQVLYHWMLWCISFLKNICMYHTFLKACIGYICPRGPCRERLTRTTPEDSWPGTAKENPLQVHVKMLDANIQTMVMVVVTEAKEAQMNLTTKYKEQHPHTWMA